MLRRMIRWLVGLGLALLVGLSIALGGGRTTVVSGAEPTPTPTLPQTNGIPGGSGGGH